MSPRYDRDPWWVAAMEIIPEYGAIFTDSPLKFPISASLLASGLLGAGMTAGPALVVFIVMTVVGVLLLFWALAVPSLEEVMDSRRIRSMQRFRQEQFH